MANLEDLLAQQLDLVGIAYERQYRAIPNRRFKFDFFIPPALLIEVQGGVYQYKPSHTSASGIRWDAEKMNLAVLAGYRVLHFTGDMVESGDALRMIEEATGEIL